VSDKVVHATDASFEQEVLAYPGAVLVDFWAPWCGPCRAVGPILEQIAEEYGGRVKVVKVNTDENPAIATRYNVRSIPTILLIRGGKVTQTLIGSRPKAQFTAILNQELGAAPSA
jgi:thioredoxin 1